MRIFLLIWMTPGFTLFGMKSAVGYFCLCFFEGLKQSCGLKAGREVVELKYNKKSNDKLLDCNFQYIWVFMSVCDLRFWWTRDAGCMQNHVMFVPFSVDHLFQGVIFTSLCAAWVFSCDKHSQLWAICTILWGLLLK